MAITYGLLLRGSGKTWLAHPTSGNWGVDLIALMDVQLAPLLLIADFGSTPRRTVKTIIRLALCFIGDTEVDDPAVPESIVSAGARRNLSGFS